ncbi:hypothetical protein ASPCAL03776 [Aspergillus calidoustus]|uniref:Transmembrane protein n=1 Tax=Aspergillus calidoustus TaxID=454130 RepID=A0A0U5FSU3_ASPCI|nr:hypothetical protein ASPCAL03776 [Aspergillus calidoustus]
MSKKPLGRSTGSLNAPIAAFTMAVVLCSYCIYSINSARRGAHVQSQFQESDSASASLSAAQRRCRQRERQDEWVQRALEERGRDGKGGV